MKFTILNDEYLDVFVNISSFIVYSVRKLISFLQILTLWILSENPKLNKPYQMPHRVHAQKLNTSIGMWSLQAFGVKFHVPAVSKCPYHFKLSLLESPHSSFSCKRSDFSIVCSHHYFQYLRILQIRSIFLKNLPHSTCYHHSPCATCSHHDLSHTMTIHLFQW